jgi:hypothetical protein
MKYTRKTLKNTTKKISFCLHQDEYNILIKRAENLKLKRNDFIRFCLKIVLNSKINSVGKIKIDLDETKRWKQYICNINNYIRPIIKEISKGY